MTLWVIENNVLLYFETSKCQELKTLRLQRKENTHKTDAFCDNFACILVFTRISRFMNWLMSN